MEHIQIIFERICKEDVGRRKLSIETIYTKNGTESFFNGKSIGINLSYDDIVSFYSAQDCFYNSAISEMMNYRNWLEGRRAIQYADSYIAECRNKINSCKFKKA